MENNENSLENLQNLVLNDYKILENWKTIDVTKRNIKRLESLRMDMRIPSLIIEIIKNGLENSTNKILRIYTDLKSLSIRFKNKIDDMSYEKFLECLKTFGGNDKSTNFHEGLTLLNYVHFILNVQGNYLESIKDIKSGFYLGAKIGKSKSTSHYWDLEIYFNSNFEYNNAISNLESLLDTFYCLGEEQIYYNDQKLVKKSFPIHDLDNKYCDNGTFQYKINKMELNKSVLLWKLANIEVYQKIPSIQLDNLNVDGFFVFSSIHNFANENRNELSSITMEKCFGLIQNYKHEHSEEDRLNLLYNRYAELKESMVDFINKVCKVPKSMIENVFFNQEYNKKDRLENCTLYINTLLFIDPLLNTSNLILYKRNDEINQMDEDSFKNFSNKINYNAKSLGIELGYQISEGEFGDIVKSNNINENKLYYVNSHECNIMKIKKFKGNFVYMTSLFIKKAEYMFEMVKYDDDLWEKQIQNDFGYEELMGIIKPIEKMDEEEIKQVEEKTQEIIKSEDNIENNVELTEQEINAQKELKQLFSQLEKEGKIEFIDSSDDSIIKFTQNSKGDMEFYNNFGELIKTISKNDSNFHLTCVRSIVKFGHIGKMKFGYSEEVDNTESELRVSFTNINQYDNQCSESKCEARTIVNDEREENEENHKRQIQNISSKRLQMKEGNYQFVVMDYERKGAKAKIPFLYTEKQFAKLQKGYNVTTKVSITKWNAFKTSVELLVKEIQEMRRIIRPILCYDENAEFEAFYNDRNGLLCFNLYYFDKNVEGQIKSDKVQDLLETVCHELAHEQFSAHNQRFVSRFHQILRLTRNETDFNGILQTIKKHVLDQL